MARGLAAAVVVVALAGTASACTKTLAGGTLERGVSQQMVASAGSRPSKLSCPDINVKKGATVTCAMTLDRQRYDVTVIVTSVSGGEVRYSVDPRPRK